MTGTVVIRFDVSSSIGTGHLRRAIALGDELAKRQISHYFVTTNESVTSAIELGIQEKQVVGFSTKLGEIDWIQRISNLTHVITDFCHHERLNSGSAVSEILQSKRLAVAVIDSMPPNHFQGDKDSVPSIVVSPYLDAESLREPPTCNKWFAGVEYAILDSNYFNIRQTLNRDLVTAGNYILVCCGGSDPNNMSEYILHILLQSKVPKVNVKIVVGNLVEKSRIESLKKIADQNQKFISLVFNRNNIADLISNCGVLIGVVGLIRYESACLGKPSFLIQNHSNFENYLRNFHRAGLGNIFFIQNQKERINFESIVKTLGTVDGFSRMSKPNIDAFDQIDGLGVQRIFDHFLNSKLN